MLGYSIGAVIAATILGWVAGMWTLKRSQQWCPRCGRTLSCANCTRRRW
jgi:hypothetical protein